MTDKIWKAFRPDLAGIVVDRPNRFVVRVLAEGKVQNAYCPNPGRIAELLYPGAEVLLEKASGGGKMPLTLAAVIRPNGTVVALVSVRANDAVESLVLPWLFPESQSVRREFVLGDCRFDFLVVDEQGQRHLVEVKACSEVEHGTALFPDAPSTRASHHLEELAQWSQQGYVVHLVFVVAHGRPRFWAPNKHTDPVFTRTLGRLAPLLQLHAVVLETQANGDTRLVQADLPVVVPDLGPDAGHVVRLVNEAEGWMVQVDWHESGFERALSKVPARCSFGIRGGPDRRQEWQAALAASVDTGLVADSAAGGLRLSEALIFDSDPRANPSFLDVIMKGRHAD